MYLIGIDPGTNHHSTCLMSLKGTSLTLEKLFTYQYKPETPLEEKLATTYKDFKGFLSEISPDIAVIETQYFGRNVRTLRSLSESVGVMKVAICLHSDAVIYDYTPNAMKLALTGKGNASKQDMIDTVGYFFGIEVSSDEADAIGAVFAHILNTPDIIASYIPEDKDSLIKKINRKTIPAEARREAYEIVMKGKFVYSVSNKYISR